MEHRVELRFTRFVELIEFFVLTQETEEALLFAMRSALCTLKLSSSKGDCDAYCSDQYDSGENGGEERGID
jgi:hypothetical protein